MSHQAIARKWRPQTFADVFGQQHVTRTLQNALRLKKLHHAYLMTGARGVGKTTAARILSRALNCEQGPTPDPCNTCANCRDMLSGTFPDLLEIDAASHNSVEDVREIVDKVRYTPQRGRYKVYIIDEVHMVSKAGFNALLKTLEEPPPHVVFILATTDPQQLLETVVSRCQRFDFKMIPVRTIYERLQAIASGEGVRIPDASLMTIAREGGGSMRDAQSLLDQVLSFTDGAVSDQEVAEILGLIDRSILLDVADACVRGDVDSAVRKVAQCAAFGYDTRTFASQLLETVRNAIVIRWVKEPERVLDLPDEEVHRLRQMAQGVEPASLQQRFDILAAAMDQIARSEQPRLILEMAVVKMASVRAYVPVEALIDRLVDLERRISGSAAPAPPVRPGGRVTNSGPNPAFVAPKARSPAEDGVRAPDRTTLRQDTAPSPDQVTERVREAPPPLAAERNPEVRPAPETPERGAAPAASVEDSGVRGPVAEPTPAPMLAEAPRPAGSGSLLGALGRLSTSVKAAVPASSALPPPPAQVPSPPPPAHAPPRSGPPTERPPAQARGPASSGPPSAAPSSRSHPAEAHRPGGPLAPPPPPKPDPPGSDRCDGPRWRRFVFSLRNRQGMGPLQAVLSRAAFLGADDREIRLGFRSDATLRQAERLIAQPDLAAVSAAWFSGHLALVVGLDGEGLGGPTLAEELDRRRAERLFALDSEARQHEGVARVLATFSQARLEGVTLPEDVEIDDVG